MLENLGPKDIMRGYCTWMPAFFDSLIKTTGPVLEVGGGYGTAVIAAYCEGYRQLTTIENDRWWYSFLLQQANPWHLVYPDMADIPVGCVWDLALIDNTPGSARQPTLESLKGRANVIVVHDVESAGYGYDFTGYDVKMWGPMPETAVLTPKTH